MEKPINIFIPAAGFGERLRPVTNYVPKPLLPVLGKPVLQRVLERVLQLPVNRIGINLHHKREAIEGWLDKYFTGRGGSQTRPYVLFPEETILGTGGALKNAEGFLKEGTFLVHNSDILSGINLQMLVEHHLSSGNLVTLAVHDHPKFNNVIVDEAGLFRAVEAGLRPAPEKSKKVAFTGIAVYEPGFLKFLPDGASGVVDAWMKAAGAGHRIGTFDESGGGFEGRPYWNDIGTPEAYAAAVFDALKSDGETVYIHPSVAGCGDVEMRGYTVIEEGCVIEEAGALHELPVLRNCILLPGSRVGAVHKLPLENCIISPDVRMDFIETTALPGTVEEDKRLIGAGGSDRKYFRVKRGKESAVLMQCRRDDPDFTRQIEYTNFFLRFFVPVPVLLEVDADEKHALFEDAGDTSLYNWLKCTRGGQEVEEMYRKVIDTLVLIHSTVTDYVAECPLLKKRIFDYEYFRWETDYFIERFVEGTRNAEIENAPAIADELDQLAFKADSFPRTIIHRDFQSQNIMVTSAGLRIIDFQGARMGPSAYDVASLLWDPYYRLKDDLRNRLVDYYISKIEDKFDADYFRETLIICRLQRHMQALGAYGFLSAVKGKKYFLKYVPEGLTLLKEDIQPVKDEYPELSKLIMRL